jgi:L-glutamine:2-deoxy-scyllo-inosose/3-amino-2,3-dideoxy-scyllo-inosose aminotransferase
VVALEALDVGAGDEVVVPAYTWMATAISVARVNAVPVIVDVDEATGCIDVDAAEAATTARTRAIVPVHVHCAVADLPRLVELGRRQEVHVVEDCAQAHGARFGDRRVGTFGSVGVFSFNQEKVLTCGEGGAVVTDDPALFDRAERLRADGSGPPAGQPRLGEYELEDRPGLLGANHCLSEFQAAVLRTQIPHLEERNRRREENARHLDTLLAEIEGVEPVPTTPGTTARTYFKYALRVDPAEFAGAPVPVVGAAVSAELGLTVEQSECRPLHDNPLYDPLTKRRHRLGSRYERAVDLRSSCFPAADAHWATTLVIHHRALLGSRREVEDLAAAIAKVKEHSEELRW